jgi:hypothetical protein
VLRLFWASREPNSGAIAREFSALGMTERVVAGFFAHSMRRPRHSAKRARCMATRTFKVDYIARVEGESSLDLRIRNGKVDGVRLSIFEPPRFSRHCCGGVGSREVLDIVARICGICPIAANWRRLPSS